jgi:hypothetical protein
MSKAFKIQPLNTEDLNRALTAVTGAIPTATGPTTALPPASPRMRIVQVNFKCSEELAELIARLGAEAGSTRRFIARLMAAAGHPVPPTDINPPDPRKRGQAA